jgi:hypothetical protein
MPRRQGERREGQECKQKIKVFNNYYRNVNKAQLTHKKKMAISVECEGFLGVV